MGWGGGARTHPPAPPPPSPCSFSLPHTPPSLRLKGALFSPPPPLLRDGCQCPNGFCPPSAALQPFCNRPRPGTAATAF